MKEKIAAIAKRLGATVMPASNEANCFIVFGDPTEWQSLKLLVSHKYGKPDDEWRISYYHVRAWWVNGTLRSTQAYNYGGENIGVNVNITRPEDVLARDINKRLISFAKEINAKNVAYTQSSIDYEAKRLAFGREFGDMAEEDREVIVYTNHDCGAQATLIGIGDSHATLSVRLPHDKMRKVINFIKGLDRD